MKEHQGDCERLGVRPVICNICFRGSRAFGGEGKFGSEDSNKVKYNVTLIERFAGRVAREVRKWASELTYRGNV